MTGDDLRRTLAEGETVCMPGVWDALSARLAADAGFSTVFVSGYCVAATQLGLPDIGLLTQTEVVDVARRVAAAVPGAQVVVDADTGYGGPLNTARTVELWEAAGVAGLFLEDQVWPKRCGHMGGKEVVPVEDWLAKLRAALDVREHLHVTARTDARGAVDLDEALERGRRAADLGVDAVFVEAPEDIGELEEVSAALGGRGAVLVANMVETGRTPLLTPDELHELGFGLVVSPLTGLFAAVRAIQGALGTLRDEGSLREHLEGLTSFDEMAGLLDLDAHRAREERWARERPPVRPVGSPGGTAS